MMIRGLTVSLLFAVLAAPAYAQDSTETSDPVNPETRQTDESEDDWRNSRKKRDVGDIFEDIATNPRSQGTGGVFGGEVKAIDRLNPESRRHLNRLRAKALAESEPGEPIDAAYEPSEAAKGDEYISRQEEKAWDEMVAEANTGLYGNGTGQGQTTGDQTRAGQTPGGQSPQGQGQGQVGQQGAQGQNQGSGSDGAQTQPRPPVLGGGSAVSAAAILDQIKGRGLGSSRTGDHAGGQTNGQAQGQANNQGQPSTGQETDVGQANGGADGNAQAQSQAQNQGQTPPQGDAQSQAQNQASNAAAQSASSAQAQAQSDAAAAQSAAANEEKASTVSPLERLKREPVDRETTGGQTSASEYLKRKLNQNR